MPTPSMYQTYEWTGPIGAGSKVWFQYSTGLGQYTVSIDFQSLVGTWETSRFLSTFRVYTHEDEIFVEDGPFRNKEEWEVELTQLKNLYRWWKDEQYPRSAPRPTSC